MTEETKDKGNKTVLVTGASGFIALRCVLQLLEQGYCVRGTIRNLSREPEIRRTLAKHVEIGGRLEITEADLTSDNGWADAVRGCTYVLHVASPFPNYTPKTDEELVVPAREGTLRVLRAAADAGVSRVVLTSSMAAIAYGHSDADTQVFDESQWSVAENCPPYHKSKTLAERAAWEFVEGLPEDAPMELSVINPGAVLGPLLDSHYSTSGEIIRKLMAREVPGTPKIGFAMVDVRDVAAAHVAAMTVPEAAGKRFCCAIEHSWMGDIAEILDKHFGPKGYKIPTRKLPDFVVRMVALFDPTVRTVIGDLGKRLGVNNKRIRDVLKWQPRTLEEMVISMGQTMIDQGVVTK